MIDRARKTLFEIVQERDGDISDLIRLKTEMMIIGIVQDNLTEELIDEICLELTLNKAEIEKIKGREEEKEKKEKKEKIIEPSAAETRLIEEFKTKYSEKYLQAIKRFKEELFPKGIQDSLIIALMSERDSVINRIGAKEFYNLGVDINKTKTINDLIKEINQLTINFEETEYFKEQNQTYEEMLDVMEKYEQKKQRLSSISMTEEEKEANEFVIEYTQEKMDRDSSRLNAKQILEKIEELRSEHSLNMEENMEFVEKNIPVGDVLGCYVYTVCEKELKQYRISFLIPANEKTRKNPLSILLYGTIIRSTKNCGKENAVNNVKDAMRIDLIYHANQKKQVKQDLNEIADKVQKDLDKSIMGQLGYKIKVEQLDEVA